MTDRERWTVYPLLFLTLGIAVKDKLVGVVNVDNVHCRNLLCNTMLVSDPQGRQQVVVSSTAGGGLVRTRGNDGQVDVAIGHSKELAGLMFVDAEGRVRPGSILVPAAGLSKPPADKAGSTPPEQAP